MTKKHLLSVFFSAFFSLVLSAEKMENFENRPELKVYKGEERGGSFELAEAPDSKGMSGKASWKDKHFKYNEYSFKKSLKLPENKDELKGVLSVWIYSPGTKKVKNIGLRLRDTKGEMFQWNRKKTDVLANKGWHKFVFDLKPGNFDVSWGRKADRNIDLPIFLHGFSIDYNPKAPGKGEVYFDEIEYMPAKDTKISSYEALYNFDRKEKWFTWNWKDKKFEIKPEKDCVAFARKPSPQKTYYPLVSRKMSLLPAGRLNRIELQANYEGSGKSSIAIDLFDSANKRFRLPFTQLAPGNNKLLWDMTKENKKFKPPFHIKDIMFLCAPSEKETVLKLFSLNIEQKLSPMECIKIDMETGTPIHVLKAGEEKKLALKLTNTANKTLSFVMEAKLSDFFCENTVLIKNFVVPAQSQIVWPIPFIPRKYGIWQLDCALRETGEKEITCKRRSFAYMNPAGPTPGKAKGFLFGICTHTERWSWKDHELEVLAAVLCGAKVVRTGVTWGSLEKEKGQWDWALMDRLVKLYWEKGIELQTIFAFTPKWAAPENAQKSPKWTDWSRAVPQMDAWRNYVSTFSKRYNGKIRFLEVWNEPDLSGFFKGKPEEYIQMLKAAYEEVKKVNPDLKVMTGGFATLRYHPGKKYPDMHEQVIEKAQDWFDIHAFHQHGTFGTFQPEVDGMLTEIRKKLKSHKPLYFNETAVSSMDDTQKAQAETLFKKIMFSFARGAMGYTWYDLRNDGYNPKNGEHNYGLLTNDFYPKAAYPVFNALALNFSDKKFLEQLDAGKNRFAFVFDGNGEQIVASWNEETATADEHLIIKTNASKAYFMDIMGNKKPLPVKENMVVVKISSMPSCTVLEGAKENAEIIGNMVKVTEKENIIPGRTAKITVELLNPFSKKHEYKINWLVPEGIETTKIADSFSILPKSKKTIQIVAILDKKAAVLLNDKFVLELYYEIKGTDWKGNVPVPLSVAKLFPPNADNKRPADFIIDKRENVFNFSENNPATAHLNWKGPEDLSAKIWLGKEDDSLTVKIKVVDDVFTQKWKGGNVWKGDNVQMALQIPGQQGFWELGLTRLADGSAEVYNWARPSGFDDPSLDTGLITEKLNDGIIYKASLPFKAFGLSKEILEKGIKFNLIINDNDGEAREGWIQIAPGIGDSKNPEPFPFVVLDK